ncbi:hypothetical protein BDV39DRAFT_167278 [Aspergillus sergii]|uniref:Uncharacterized protein n=1 Tax=Aspergillus sergii TaxID=1034303 RepID=A0A5N6XI91_9EURO|nr:hypothetical protein BDV39DRAFT_167278 [Aspergillus sergii]
MDYSCFGRALHPWEFWHSELRKEVVDRSMSGSLLLLDKIATWLVFICLLFPVPDYGTFFPLALIETIEFSLPL